MLQFLLHFHQKLILRWRKEVGDWRRKPLSKWITPLTGVLSSCKYSLVSEWSTSFSNYSQPRFIKLHIFLIPTSHKGSAWPVAHIATITRWPWQSPDISRSEGCLEKHCQRLLGLGVQYFLQNISPVDTKMTSTQTYNFCSCFEFQPSSKFSFIASIFYTICCSVLYWLITLSYFQKVVLCCNSNLKF